MKHTTRTKSLVVINPQRIITPPQFYKAFEQLSNHYFGFQPTSILLCFSLTALVSLVFVF